MKIFKLGCHWGSGQPNYYKLIKDKSFAIGESKRVYSIGDLVLVTDGFTVKAIIEILSKPVPVTSKPELEADFEKYEIDYEDWVEIYQGTFYELSPDEEFPYPIQRGMVQIQQDEIKNKVISIYRQKKY